jgi:hypothetical protein
MLDQKRPGWLDSGRIPSLDGLRAIGVVFVLLGGQAICRTTAEFRRFARLPRNRACSR